MTENTIDGHPFHEEKSDTGVWSGSTVRSWMNGFGPSENKLNRDYTDGTDSMMNVVFTEKEKDIILPTSVTTMEGMYPGVQTEPTTAYLYLPSIADVSNPDYGFSSFLCIDDQGYFSPLSTVEEQDQLDTRVAFPTAYAYATGAGNSSRMSGCYDEEVNNHVYSVAQSYMTRDFIADSVNAYDYVDGKIYFFKEDTRMFCYVTNSGWIYHDFLSGCRTFYGEAIRPMTRIATDKLFK